MERSGGKARTCGIGMAILLVFTSFLWGGMPQTKTVDQKEFSIGISARTNNAQEAAGNGVIAKQWDKFYKEEIQGRIPDKADSTTYAVLQRLRE